MRDDIYSIRSDFKMCEFFYENPRNMKGARYKMLLIFLGTNKKFFTPKIIKLRVKCRVKILPRLNKIIYWCCGQGLQ